MINVDAILEDHYQSWRIGLILYALLIICFVFDVMNIRVFWSPLGLHFVPIILFVGSIKFRQFFPVWLGFLLGLLTDILSYSALGVAAGLYFLTVAVCRWQYRFILAQPFYVIWMFFAVYWLFSLCFIWGGHSLYSRYVFELSASLPVFLYGVFCFPIVWALGFFIRRFTSSSEGELV